MKSLFYLIEFFRRRRREEINFNKNKIFASKYI